MANRKLQKDIDIIFKKISEGLHEFNYHYERYESINTEDDSDNQREKEKLENDLKKEIKRLQKFREQIKIWQSNDVIKTLGLSSTALSNKLNDNKKLIEEAMEVYKDVERSSKLKTFSNQSILMASKENHNNSFRDDDDDDDDEDSEDESFDEFDSNDEDDEDEDLRPESQEIVSFLKDSVLQLSNQTKKLNNEFDKLSQKKLRKNNLSTIESKKEKIQSTIEANKFHSKKLLKIIKLIRANKLTDVNVCWVIKNDLEKFIESGENDEFDEGLYDDIFNSVTAEEEDFVDYTDNNTQTNANDANTNENDILATPVKPEREENHTNHFNGPSQPEIKSKVSSTTNSLTSPLPKKVVSPELASPAIVRNLKPAPTPSKPVGTMKWSAAAVAGLADHSSSSSSKSPEPSGVSSNGTSITSIEEEQEQEKQSKQEHHRESQQTDSQPKVYYEDHVIQQQQREDSNKYSTILRESGFSNVELNLFSDMKLVTLPPGMQDLVVSFTSKRNKSDDFKLLVDEKEYNQYTIPITKPFLPENINNFPVQFLKLQAGWNKIRGQYEFNNVVNEIKELFASNNANAIPRINELTNVLFYGFYYGITPVENLIAEESLFNLGWKPYRLQEAGQNPLISNNLKSNNYFFWVRKINSLPSNDSNFEFGDFQVFNLTTWEIFVKNNYKLETRLLQVSPSITV
ncbi:Not1 N-terminal domain, CCR4-Not complex component-domain-containing protein [Scheffersomyces amazonensis]|uniref:Not1 N-terminal domain, CCR4-Not complex component-domain-containing protein n=1 Tax=Scheffersomyces amazonensis TaxID=1078765 RepID=UPI00315D197E